MSTNDPLGKVAADLTAITRMADHLEAEAVAHGDHPLMPGGPAMVALAPVANLEAWANYADVETGPRPWTSSEDEDPDEAWPPFQILRFWSEAWRRDRDQDYLDAPTIATEANWLRWSLEWAWDNEPHFDEFAADVRRARAKLENILLDGDRPDRSRVVCNACDSGRRLVRIYGDDEHADWWKCPACKRRYTDDDLRRALAYQLRHGPAREWLSRVEAIALLVDLGHSRRNAERLADAGEPICDLIDRRRLVRWPEVWRVHLAARQRVALAETTRL